MQEQEQQQEHEQEYMLSKRRPRCTGMFWRSDPSGKTRVASNRDWPRDNAILRGNVVTVRGQKWLHATHVRQFYDKEFVEAPENAYMPFEYNNHYYLEPYAKKAKTDKKKKASDPSSSGLFGWMRRNKTKEPLST